MKHGGDRYRNEIKYDFSVNTNPFGIPNRVHAALADAISQAQYYPDPEHEKLTHALAKRYAVKPEQILCANGASELFTSIALTLQPKKALLTMPCFGGYERSLKAVSCEIVQYNLAEADGFCLTSAVLEQLTDDLDIIYLACPNNPNGSMLNPDLFLKIIEIAKKNQTMVVLDLCFFELMDPKCQQEWMDCHLRICDLVNYSNLMIVNAFTKTLALAGVRIGYGFVGNPELADRIRMSMPEWNNSIFAQAAGVAAVHEGAYVLQCASEITKWKANLRRSLSNLGAKVYDSDANFLLMKWPDEKQAAEMAERLLNEYGILIRNCDSFQGLSGAYWRIAIRQPKENALLLNALGEITNGRIHEKITYEQNKIEHVLPQDIESTSMATIRKELQLMNYQLDETLAPVILRCIHTSADFEYADTLCFSDNAVRIAQDLIRKGADIVTDTNMGLSGINKKELAKYGGCVHCFMAEESVAAEAKERGLTRATVSMEHAAAIDKPIIFAIGNAPTALVALRGLYEKGYRPAFIIGVPVGFVNVVASKEMIMETDIPYIVNRGRKGGSNVAAAICNALLYDMRDQ